MSSTETAAPAIGQHGAAQLPAVDVDSFNLELKDEDGFLGDRANHAAFYDLLEKWRKPLRKFGDDPFGKKRSDKLSHRKLDEILVSGDLDAAGVIHSATEEFAAELALVVRRFLKAKAWTGTEAIVIGGGFRESRIGELALARADIMLKADGQKISLVPIRHDPDEAALIGCVHLAPSWIFEGRDAFLAVDIGGSNIRAGLVLPRIKAHPDLKGVKVHTFKLWHHADDAPGREEAVSRLVDMLKAFIRRARRDKLKLAPFIGISCPGVMDEDGFITKGAQNLPGNWESGRFNLPARLREDIPAIDGHESVVLMHNDAVVQGLSEVPYMREVRRWGVLTIGTGLGNARFSTRAAEGKGQART